MFPVVEPLCLLFMVCLIFLGIEIVMVLRGECEYQVVVRPADASATAYSGSDSAEQI